MGPLQSTLLGPNQELRNPALEGNRYGNCLFHFYWRHTFKLPCAAAGFYEDLWVHKFTKMNLVLLRAMQIFKLVQVSGVAYSKSFQFNSTCNEATDTSAYDRRWLWLDKITSWQVVTGRPGTHLKYLSFSNAFCGSPARWFCVTLFTFIWWVGFIYREVGFWSLYCF